MQDRTALRVYPQERKEEGRLEEVARQLRQWCLDVGHNPHAAQYVARRLPSPPKRGRQWALIGMLNDKDADGVIQALLPRVTDWVCVTLAGERGRTAAELAEPDVGPEVAFPAVFAVAKALNFVHHT